MKYASIIPLIGGMTLGNKKVVGKNPEAIFSYSAFEPNDSHIVNYLEDVPYYKLDSMSEEEKATVTEQYKGLDFITTVCPCAGLSMMNTKAGADYKSNQWMLETAGYVLGDLKPKVFWGENAPGLYTAMGRPVVEKLREIAKNSGYSMSMIKTSTIFHGVPHRRQRTFYFFWKNSKVPELNYYRESGKNLLDYLDEIPKDSSMKGWNPPGSKAVAIANYKPYKWWLEKSGMTHSEFVRHARENKCRTFFGYIHKMDKWEEMKEWAEGVNWESFESPINRQGHHVFHCYRKAKMGKGWWDPSPLLVLEDTNAVTGRMMCHGVHPDEERLLDLRECMHLMGMPHDMTLNHPKEFNHIAQNVPVKTASDWTKEVVKFINGELKLTEYDFMRQSNFKQKIEEVI